MKSREFNAHEMVVAKTGLKLKEAVPGETTAPPEAPASPGDIGWPKLAPNVSRIVAQHSLSAGYNLVRLKAQLEPLSELANFLPILDNVPVVDKTGLTGKYSVVIETWSKSDVPGGTVFDAVEKLGLKLEPRKVTVETVVVDRVSKTPTAN